MIAVPDRIRVQARRSPETVAVESGGDRLTYAQVIAQAGGLAEHLRAAGVRPGDLVAVAVARGVDLVTTLIGVHLCGAAYVPLDPEHPADRLTYVLRDAGARVLVTADATGSPAVRAAARVHLDDVAPRPCSDEFPALPGDSAAYVVYTSGSTGRPKGVLVTHRALANVVESMHERLGLPDDAVLPAVTTVSFDIAGLELFLPLTTGGRVAVARQIEAADPRRLAALLARTGARALQATPITWRLLLETGWSPPPGFTVLCGGERLPPDLAGRLLDEGVVLWDLYGPTETTIWSAATRYQRGTPARFHPVANTALRLLDERLDPVPPGGDGELYIGGAGVAAGYPGRFALTAHRFIADPYAEAAGARLYRTGDIARHHPDGRIEILGRDDDQIKIRGFRVEPAEIENVLTRHPGVAEAAVRAADDAGGTTRLVGYIRSADPAAPPDPGRLRRHLARSLPAYMIPTRFVFLEAFPTTPNGKLDRSALAAAVPMARRPDPAGPRPDDPDGDGHPGTGSQRMVTTILAEVLGRDRVGPHDDFFAIGGNSLLAIQAVSRLNAELATPIPIAALFEVRTAFGLALLMADGADPQPRLVPLAGSAAPRLSSDQWRVWRHQRQAPHSVADNEPMALGLPDPLDLPALRAALTGLLARHDILRTYYPDDAAGQPVPVVLPVSTVRLAVEDGDPAAVLAGEVARPFDLATEPPIRIRLVRAGPGQRAVLLLVVHRIAADDHSRDLIAGQVRAAYRGRTVPDPALRYADYAHWQRQRAASPAARAHLDFWRAALDGLDQAELRTDRPRPDRRDWRAGTVHFAVTPAVADALREIADDHDTTLFTGLLAGFYAVLARHATGTDLTVGVPASGRDQPELADLVGGFTNTAVIRVDLGGIPTFAQLLTRVREAVLAAREHAATPVEDIIAAAGESVATGWRPGRNPLFDAMFELRGAGADVAGCPLPDPVAVKVDLHCHLDEHPDGGLRGRIGYATQLFDEATVVSFADGFVALLAGVTRDPARALDHTPSPEPHATARSRQFERQDNLAARP